MHVITEPRFSTAAILAVSNSPLVLDTIELPQRLVCGQVLVQILYSGICGSQLNEIDAIKGPDPFLPHLLGHEASALVLQCGPGVTRVKKDDLVVLHWRKAPGIDAAPPVYMWKEARCNAGWIATFAEYAVISENRMTSVPATADPVLLPLFGCAVLTGLGAVVNDARVKPGDAVCVFGAGGVGLHVIQGARMAGAYPIIALDIHDNRLDLARTAGATHALNSRERPVERAIRDILASCGNPGGADVCFDNTGNVRVIELAYGLLEGEGRLVCIGVPKEGDKASLPTLPLHFGKSITGSHGGNARPERDIPRYLRLVETGRLCLEPLVTNRYPLSAINDAIADMRSGKAAGRCIIDCCRAAGK